MKLYETKTDLKGNVLETTFKKGCRVYFTIGNFTDGGNIATEDITLKLGDKISNEQFKPDSFLPLELEEVCVIKEFQDYVDDTIFLQLGK